jgi:hypothetical protein
VLPPVNGEAQFTGLRIYRAPTPAGPWTIADAAPASFISAYNNLWDINPSIGHETFYAATVIDALSNESPRTPALSISARASA